MPDNSDLAIRMKGYENVQRNYLTGRMPVLIRVDGKSFHTFTRGMERPFDHVLINLPLLILNCFAAQVLRPASSA